ncbi:MAG: bifunctional nuclease family protein [Bdellovibrionales bacterium]|nr:bifunctional nuclease family protein [Bdellovibrionales bacterium]
MSDKTSEAEIEMFVAGLVLDPASNAPIVVLKDASGDTCLPIWIGLAEATAIASALKKVQLARPMTHDLLKDLVDELGGRVVKVVITELQENTFIANIEIVVGDVVKVVDSRPSDAIALAVRTDAQIMVRPEVLDQAQVTLVSVNTEEGEEEFEVVGGDEEGGSKNFANIDKDKWAEILAEMDPDDFKYKM